MDVAQPALWERPVVVAPMAGGPSTADLVVASLEAGMLGFLAAGYKRAAEVEAEIAAVRARTSRPFGVNVFVPGAPTSNRRELDDYLQSLQPEVSRLGVPLGAAAWEDDDWDAKTELLVEAGLAACSFTFGCPPAALVSVLHSRDTTSS